MTVRSSAADHPPLSDLAGYRWVGNAVTATLVTRLGARLAMADAVERATHCRGRARG
jgi:hypothetical protein